MTDSSDPNWWKGYNERGEGLFPANFVTGDLAEPVARAPSPAAAAVGGAEGAGGAVADSPPAHIDEATMDAALALLHEADPRAEGAGEAELARLEARAHGMGALVDAALERADRRHARLTQLSAELVDALNLYHSLMRDPLKPFGHGPGPGMPPPPAYPPHAFGPPPLHPPPPRYVSCFDSSVAIFRGSLG